jgi:D-glycero-D-manno-heptose 1,7-bisphosphate phosphatase
MPDRKAVFFDRDGTLMEEEDHCDCPTRVRAVKGVKEGLKQLKDAGWAAIIITNQSGIGRGYFTMADFEAVNQELYRQIGGGIDGAYCCPDLPTNPTPRRKPGIGMIEEAVRDHGIDTRKSWFVGDKPIDIQCGQNAGCRTILVRTGYGAKGEASASPDFVVDDAAAAIQIILSHS